MSRPTKLTAKEMVQCMLKDGKILDQKVTSTSTTLTIEAFGHVYHITGAMSQRPKITLLK